MRADLTRTLVGPLALAVSGSVTGIDWFRIPRADGQVCIRNGVEAPCTLEIEEHDAIGRVALVLDLRDREFEPQRGVLLEGGVYAGSFGEGYDGGYAIGSGFVNPRFGTVIAARLGGRSVSAESSLDARYLIPAWESARLRSAATKLHAP
jgi:hypothetical protein